MSAADRTDLQANLAGDASRGRERNVDGSTGFRQPFSKSLNQFEFVAATPFELFMDELKTACPVCLGEGPELLDCRFEAKLAVENQSTQPQIIVITKQIFTWNCARMILRARRQRVRRRRLRERAANQQSRGFVAVLKPIDRADFFLKSCGFLRCFELRLPYLLFECEVRKSASKI